MIDADRRTRVFLEVKPRLMGLAYRMLGSHADAEDAVQDTYVKWLANRDVIENAGGWLMTVCSRVSLDRLKVLKRERERYVGPWLPEPIGDGRVSRFGESFEYDETLSTAFMLMMDKLSARERLVFILREIFDYPYTDISEIMGVSEAGGRKLFSRAKQRLERDGVGHQYDAAHASVMLGHFVEAIKTGEMKPLEAMLVKDVELIADHGGKAVAVDRLLHGPMEVMAFVKDVLHPNWHDGGQMKVLMNGEVALIYRHEGVVVSCVRFAFDEEWRVRSVFVMRNPDKLAQFD
ncbi:ECF RNA polymerase sigma factor SigJ [Poriferisphaera corsica]|uniref:ECF RNA polymerase sigma factor SigJ n=1 Tax=Poriferisphaera corsica TaxID=2528020 RepID=A0A517YWF6_9BACT|nr:sigma-70 family RNA polymerase sigma factor [Poriferisphaera corsica]QDU34558.1 ECF RNA polymerase sigma factor SigJ [Poriferisphaera corsica]